MSGTTQYRPEIDGLRAIAIIPVVLFHLALGVSGGFVGVDVFFVISGYLISGIIIRSVDSGKWSAKQFWMRRCRRILPASVVMILAVLCGAYFLMSAQHFDETAVSALYQSVFLESIHLAGENLDYYATGAEERPLLHTWSLSVEELFYLAFPFLFVFLWKRGRKAAIIFLFLLATVSLIKSEFGAVLEPRATYYQLTTRGWELLVGVLAQIFVLNADRKSSEILSAIGLGLIGYACFAYDKTTVFPGFAALVPTVGAAAILIANEKHQTLVGKVFSFPLFVFIGKISFSLYLWHWPLYVFAKYYAIDPLTTGDRLGILAASLGVATLSYYLVEQPFRQGWSKARARTVYSWGIGSLASVALLSTIVTKNAGWPERFNGLTEKHRHYPEMGDEDLDLKKIGDVREILRNDGLTPIGTEGAPQFLVWSDSHGHALKEVIDESAKRNGISGRHAMRCGSLPIPNVWTPRPSGKHEMLAYNAAIEQYIYDTNIRDVILIGRWSPAVTGEENRLLSETDTDPDLETSPDILRRNLTALVDRLKSRGVNTWIMSQVPEHEFDPVEKLIARRGRVPGLTLAKHQDHQRQTNSILEGAGSTVLDPTPFLFGGDDRTFLMAEDGIYSEWHDADHLNTIGARRLRPLFDQLMYKVNDSAKAVASRELE